MQYIEVIPLATLFSYFIPHICHHLQYQYKRVFYNTRKEIFMSYIGGGPYYAEPCPECGAVLWNGRCENPDCPYHWHPKDEDEDDKDPS